MQKFFYTPLISSLILLIVTLALPSEASEKNASKIKSQVLTLNNAEFIQQPIPRRFNQLKLNLTPLNDLAKPTTCTDIRIGFFTKKSLLESDDIKRRSVIGKYGTTASLAIYSTLSDQLQSRLDIDKNQDQIDTLYFDQPVKIGEENHIVIAPIKGRKYKITINQEEKIITLRKKVRNIAVFTERGSAIVELLLSR